MATVDTKREQASELYADAWRVAFGHDGAVVTAQDSASGQLGAYDDADVEELTDRDKRMLAIGTLAGAAAAVSRATYPFEDGQESLERADLLLEYAASVGCRDRESQPLFERSEKAVA